MSLLCAPLLSTAQREEQAAGFGLAATRSLVESGDQATPVTPENPGSCRVLPVVTLIKTSASCATNVAAIIVPFGDQARPSGPK